MISEEDLEQDPDQAKAKAEALLNNPAFFQELVATRAYWSMALKEAVSEANPESNTDASRRQSRSLDSGLKDDIHQLSNAFVESMNESKNTMAAVQTMADDLETDHDDPYTPFLKAAAGAPDIKTFFTNNPQLLLTLVENGDLIKNFSNKKERAETYKKIADTFLRWVDMLHRGGTIIGAPIAPVQWIMVGISSPFAIAGAYLNYQAARNNPDYSQQKQLKAKSILTMVVGLATLIIIPLILGVAGAAVVAPALGILMTIYSLSLCAHHLVQLGTGLVALYKEFKQKEPAETYNLRVSRQALKCLKSAADVVFYLAASAAAIAGLVGLFGNPFVLGVLAGAITVISYVTLGVLILSTVLQKVADNKITTIEAGLNEIENKLKTSRSPHMQRLKNVVSGFKIASKMRESFLQDRKENPNHDAMNFLMKKAIENQGVILKAAKEVGLEDYANMAEETIKTIEILKNSENPILQGIEHFTGKDTTEVLQATLKEIAGDKLSNIIQETALLIKIPKKQRKEALSQKGKDLVSETVGASDLGKKFDQIVRYQTTDENVHVRLNANPSDEALMALMELNKDLQPLKMNACGDSKTILRVMEAAKLMGIQVNFSESDIALLKPNSVKNSKEELERLDYFKALQAVDTKTFQKYVSKHHDHCLGEGIEQSILKKWQSHKPKV